MGEGSQRVSVRSAEPTPGGKHIRAGSKLYSFKGGQIQPAAPANQEPVQPAVPSFPHKVAPLRSGRCTDSSLQVIEMIPCPIKRQGFPIEVFGERHRPPSTTDEEGDMPMKNAPTSVADLSSDGGTNRPVTLPKGALVLKNTVAFGDFAPGHSVAPPPACPSTQYTIVPTPAFEIKTPPPEGKGKQATVNISTDAKCNRCGNRHSSKCWYSDKDRCNSCQGFHPSRCYKQPSMENKGKGRAETLPVGAPIMRTTAGLGDFDKGLEKIGKEYGKKHPNTTKPFLGQKHTRKDPNDKRGINGGPSPLEKEKSRCPDCGNLSHAGKCWPTCDDCGKRYRPEPVECRGRPKYNFYPPPPQAGKTQCQTCGKYHLGKCRRQTTNTPNAPMPTATTPKTGRYLPRQMTSSPDIQQTPTPATASNAIPLQPGPAKLNKHHFIGTGKNCHAVTATGLTKAYWRDSYNRLLQGTGVHVKRVEVDPRLSRERILTVLCKLGETETRATIARHFIKNQVFEKIFKEKEYPEIVIRNYTV